MNDSPVFYPPRRLGVVFLLLLAGGLGVLGFYGVMQATRAAAGLPFVLFSLAALPAVLGVPLLFYQLYGLLSASYTLERNGIRLRWGLRAEDIPVHQVQWVRSESQAGLQLPLPFLAWPGAVLGLRRLNAEQTVEFFASQSRELVLVATAERVYALSPAAPQAFLQAYRQFAELGSIRSIPARSTYPSRLLANFWADRAARGLLFAGSLWALALLVATAAGVTGHAPVYMHAQPGSPLSEAVPAVRLLLLPLLNAMLFFANLLLGLFFYRDKNTQPLSYLMWTTSLAVALLFSGAVLTILWGSG